MVVRNLPLILCALIVFGGTSQHIVENQPPQDLAVAPGRSSNIEVGPFPWREENGKSSPKLNLNRIRSKPVATDETVKSRKRRTYASPIISILNPDCDDRFRTRVVTAYAGSGIILMCDPCGYVSEGILWTKLPLEAHGHVGDEAFEEVEIPGNEEWITDNKFYGENNALGIIRVTAIDNGIYQCKVKEFFEGENMITKKPLSYYYVEVKTTSYIENVVLNEGQRPRKDETVPGGDPPLVIYSLWSLWGECDLCDTPSVRTRVGYCYTLMQDDVYAGGVPCHSGLIPGDEAGQLSSYQDQRLIMPCVIYCSEKGPPGVFEGITNPILIGGSRSYKKRGEDGGHAGIQYIRVEEESPLRLECPGAFLEDIVRWRIGGDVMELHIEDAGWKGDRVFMDPEGALIFRKLFMNDTNAYFCEVNKRRAANYRINVFKAIKDKEEIIEALMVLGSYIVVFTLVFLVVMAIRQFVLLTSPPGPARGNVGEGKIADPSPGAKQESLYVYEYEEVGEPDVCPEMAS